MNLKELSKIVNDFQMERGWKIPEPNLLTSSIAIELGELIEHYQWQNSFKKLNAKEKKEVAFEFVDVFFYLFALAHRSGITDIEPYFLEKLNKLAVKYPIGINQKDYYRQKKKYRKTGKNKTYD